jgi:choline kinase
MTKVIILAAGEGTRLKPFTNDKPKCCIEFRNKRLIDYQIEIFNKNNIYDINVVAGYKAEKLLDLNANIYINKDYKNSNMVESLFFEDQLFNENINDLIISYGDIIFNDFNFKKIISSKDDISLMVDSNWYDLWKYRMTDPLLDAESLKLDNKNYITELGQKITKITQAEGQYTGLIFIKKKQLVFLRNCYFDLKKNKNIKKIYMTDFFQILIKMGIKIKAILVKNGWLEFDTSDDLSVYNRLINSKIMNKNYEFL